MIPGQRTRIHMTHHTAKNKQKETLNMRNVSKMAGYKVPSSHYCRTIFKKKKKQEKPKPTLSKLWKTVN